MIKKIKQLQQNKVGGKSYGIIIRNLIILFLLFIILVLIFILSLVTHESEVIVPDRPNYVPVSAIWSGGQDGGYWYELVDIKDSVYRFKVYNYNGELLLDADYKLKYPTITKNNWHEMHPYYTGDSLSTIDSNKSLYFESIYPAHGGSDWDIIKEKYKIK